MKSLYLPFLPIALRLFGHGSSTNAAPLHSRSLAVRQSDLGPIDILYQNDLSINSALGAILLSQPVTASQASSACQSMGEQLIAHDGCKLPDDVVAQLSYYVSQNRLTPTDSLWVGGEAQSYNVGRASVASSSSSNTKQGVLCSHTAPPTLITRNVSDLPRSSAYGEDKKIALQAGKYTLTGTRDLRSFRFLNLPFAAPPIGTSRFMYAKPYDGPMELDALEYGHACPQVVGGVGNGPENITYSEDCLNLNVFTTSLVGNTKSRAELKPVLVYIYGGAFVVGRNSEQGTDGGNLASRGDIVVITINYRLGALGFLASGSDLPGNAGISDMIMALKWIKEHVSAFGGDPEKVTIMGESAGAQSVSALLASSASTGLYRAAIMESNPWMPWATRSMYTNSYTPTLATALQCPTKGPEMVECLQKLDFNQLVSGTAHDAALAKLALDQGTYMNTTLILSSAEPFLPVADGLIDDQIFYLAGNGTIPNKVPTLVGTTAGEGTAFIYPILTEPVANTEQSFNDMFSKFFFSDQIQKIKESDAFPVDTNDPDTLRKLASDLFTYNYFTCPTQEIISVAAQTKALPQTWLYEFNSGYQLREGLPPQCVPEGTGINVCHSDDVIVTFGALNLQNNTVSPGFLEYTRYVADSWISFIRNMDPNPDPEMLKLRGRSYEYTLEESQAAPWLPYDPNSITLQGAQIETTQILQASGSKRGPVPNRRKCELMNYIDALPQRRINNAM